MTTPIGLKFPTGWDLNQSKYEEINDLPLMSTPGPVLIIIAAYLIFILKLGPKFMKNREPFNLKNTLIIYNFVQVLLSLYIVYKIFLKIYEWGVFPKQCIMAPRETRRETIELIWLYFAAKITELLDTVFFVLRKKYNQTTFLHLYHHLVMCIGTWALLKYTPTHTLLFIGFLNSLIHVFMYSYYGLAAFGPKIAKYLTWKKYMTTLQLVQFVTIIFQFIGSVIVSECPPPRGMAIFVALNTSFILLLFLNFYKQSYVNKARKQHLMQNNNIKEHKLIEEKCQ